ncbi:hypothetical protein KC331_g13132 [Hortaea werneckii]|nr:hypothetical protein KC331_g13132 [Hortaea werneckii]KAI7703541.1 hypothetical protein KC353_g14060 [Hortaea werneckii]
MQIRGEYPAEPPPAYEDPRHQVSTPNFDLAPPPRGAVAEAPSADQTPSTERSGLLGELLDRFSEPDSDINRHQQQQPNPEQPNLGSIGDHKIQTDGPHPTSEPEIPSQSVPQQDRKRCTSTGSKPLSGTFPLYDSLSLTTHSGSLNAIVIPQPANPLKPLPAELRVHSHSGSINLDTRIPISTDADDNADGAEKWSRAIWQRGYRTAVTSHSSRIDARVILGEKTLVQSHSAILEVEAVILPKLSDPQERGETGGGRGQGQKGGKKKKAGPNSPPPPPLSLHTQTHSSNQNVRVIETCAARSYNDANSMASLPQQHQQQQKQILTTYHHTHSGKLQLYYPKTWTGKIEGTMGKSKAEITIHGTGVDVIQQTPNKFLAKRRCQSDSGGQYGGEGEEGMANTLRFYSFSGRVEIFFG